LIKVLILHIAILFKNDLKEVLMNRMIILIVISHKGKRIIMLLNAWLSFLLIQIIKNGVEVCNVLYWVFFGLQFPIALLIFGCEAVKLYKYHKNWMGT
jgi:hypothetical protein